MHSLTMILGGFALLAVFLVLEMKQVRPFFRIMKLEVYLVLWALVTLVNMWLGITRAGYGFLEELFILPLVWSPSGLVAIWLLKRRRVGSLVEKR